MKSPTNLADLLRQALHTKGQCGGRPSLHQRNLSLPRCPERNHWVLTCTGCDRRITADTEGPGLAWLLKHWIETTQHHRKPGQLPAGSSSMPTIRFEPASNGDTNRQDVVAFINGHEHLRFKNLVIDCPHTDKGLQW